MLSLPDFREKQILFITAEKDTQNKIRFWNENVRYEADDKVINQLSCHKILAIFIIGDFSITTKLIQNCKKYGISLFLLKNNFEVYAEINSMANGNYLLREKQYNLDKSIELDIAKHVVKNKIYNQYALLAESKKINNQEPLFQKSENKIKRAKTHQELLGIEGSHTKDYFLLYFKDIGWNRRMPRAKVDITNVLMDIGYTFLFNFVDSLLCLYGFDSYKGFYHKLFFQRKSLACDMVEPFRCLIDKQIVKSYNLKQINEKDFFVKKGSVLLSYDKQQKYLKIFANCVMAQKEDLFTYIRDFYYCVLNDKTNYPFLKLN